ncbi:branched-chain amino acid ABC transporter substrate-binding protein [Synergistales bacterium]|nr:branched-chain amino acid ABC transporter substrate-binding protein [Synergistales bacterium]GHV52986.1 branched-chain amino acid ABC transporter substrate-binding protein [Synergistales bacterium]
MRRFLSVAAVCLFVLGAAGAAFAADPIKIGFYNCLTGQNAFGGQLELEGAQLANKEVPTVLGRKIELVVVDNKSDKVEAANAVTRLINRDKVAAIIGTYGSSLALAGGEVAETGKVPVVGTSCTNPLVTQGKKFYFRVCFIDPLQGAGAAAYAYKNLKAKKAALLVDVANDYAVGLANFFKQDFIKRGGEIVSDMRYQSGDQDFTAQLTEIISKNPDMVFLPAYFAEGAIVLKQAKELGAKFRFMGGDAMDNPEMVTLGGDSVEGFIYTGFAYAPDMKDMNPVAKKFTASWAKAYPNKLTNANAALGYDAYLMIVDAIKRANSADPQKIRDALEQTKNLELVTGKTTMDQQHNPQKDVGILEIKDGKKVFVGTIVP